MPGRPAAGRSRRLPARSAEESGQASVELVAVLPALLVGALIAAQLALAGQALWSAGLAARAAARAEHVGGEAAAAGRRALPPHLRETARIGETSDGGVRVAVHAPRILPWLPELPVEAHTALGQPDA